MSGYATDHAGAKASVRAAGASIMFEVADSTAARSEDAHGNLAAARAGNVLAYAVEDTSSMPEMYAAAKLVQGEAPLLFVVFDVYGASIEPGARAWWAGRWWAVRAVQPYRPDGTVLFAYVILAR